MKHLFERSAKVIACRQDWHCMRCGRNTRDGSWPGVSTHHRQLRRSASPDVRDSPANLVRLCGTGTTGCHGWVHAHPALARRFGWIVSMWADPRRVPVKDWRGQWMLLDDDGDYRTISRGEAMRLISENTNETIETTSEGDDDDDE